MRFVEKTTQIEVAKYAAYREAVTMVIDNLKQDVILVPNRGKGAKKKAPKSLGKAP